MMENRQPKTTLLVVLLVAGLVAAAAPGWSQENGPTANAGSDRSTSVGTQLTFNGAGSSGDITTYHWTFGDGTSATGVSVTKSFSGTGVFTVTLTVTDTDSATDQDTAQVTVTQDTVDPSISHTNVTSGTPGQAISVVGSLTDNVGVQSGTVFYKNATMSSYQSTSMTQTDGTNNWSANIPSSVVGGSFVLYYVRATDTSSNTQGYPSGVLSDNTLAVNVTLADTSAPKITHTQVTNATAGQARSVTATITDTGSGVDSATLYYKRATSSSFSSATMSADGSTYTASVPANVVTTSHAHYYIQATDGADSPNTARSPQSAPGTPHGMCVSDGILRETITVIEPSDLASGTASSLTVSVSASSAKSLTNVTTWALVDGSWTQIHQQTPSSGQKTVEAYAVAVPASAVTADGLQYYVQVNGTDSSDVARTGFHGCTVAAKTVSLPASDDSNGGGGGGGGGSRRVTASDRVEADSSSENGKTTATAQLDGEAGKGIAVGLESTDSPLRELVLDLTDELVGGDVQVEIQTSPPTGDEPPTGWHTRLYLKITLPEGATTNGELTFELTREELDGRDPHQVVLLHEGATWEPLETLIEDADADPLVFTAIIPGFSAFAVAYDDEAPTVEIVSPEDGAQVGQNPTIEASLSDNRGIDTQATRLLLDGEETDAQVEAGRVVFEAAGLSAGEHTVSVQAHDLSGLETSESWSFQVEQTSGAEDETEGTKSGTKGIPGPAVMLVVLVGLLVAGIGVRARRRGG